MGDNQNGLSGLSLIHSVNLISGLEGQLSSAKQLPLVALPMVIAALAGGAVGSYLGSRQFSPGFIKKLLAVVLTISGYKLIFT